MSQAEICCKTHTIVTVSFSCSNDTAPVAHDKVSIADIIIPPVNNAEMILFDIHIPHSSVILSALPPTFAFKPLFIHLPS